MKKKESIKINLLTAITLFILILLILSGVMYYIYVTNKTRTANNNNQISPPTITENTTPGQIISKKFQMSKEDYPKVDRCYCYVANVCSDCKRSIEYV